MSLAYSDACFCFLEATIKTLGGFSDSSVPYQYDGRLSLVVYSMVRKRERPAPSRGQALAKNLD
jgi:hypothetical protein